MLELFDLIIMEPMVNIFQLSISENLTNSYQSYLSELRQDVMNDDDTDLLSEDFIIDFKDIIKSKSLDKYSTKKFYWLNLIDQLVDTIDVTEGMLEGELAVEDAIDFLEGSEFLGMFLEGDKDPKQNLKDIIEIQELQIISFFWLHINTSENWEPQGPVAYRSISELGEGNGKLFLGSEHSAYLYPQEVFQDVLPVIAYLPSSNTLVFDDEGETIESNLQDDMKLTYSSKKKNIHVIGDLSHFEKFNNAFERLEVCHPKLYDFIFTFTNTIIPVDEKGIVSYSMDTLPGHSCINTFDRDFVDLLDDLVHENGHHYLNAMIEGDDDLINEDEDKIFYSPWRRALRPIRGLYHGVCTFYWAFELFKKLRKFDDLFNKEEVIKIHQRFVEEGHMILNCKEQVIEAYKLGKITKIGNEFINTLIKNVDDSKSLLQESRIFIKDNDESVFIELQKNENEIEKAQKSFQS